MKRMNGTWTKVVAGTVLMLATPVPEADALWRGRAVTGRSYGSVRQGYTSVVRTGRNTATVTGSAVVATPYGAQTVMYTDNLRRPTVGLYQPGTVSRRTVASLPRGYRTVHVAGMPYYYYDGVYYVREYDEETAVYVECEAPVGAVVDSIPANYSTVVVGGRTYYSDGTVYYTRAFQDGEVSYLLVQRP